MGFNDARNSIKVTRINYISGGFKTENFKKIEFSDFFFLDFTSKMQHMVQIYNKFTIFLKCLPE